jgi:hypothetical protein
MNIRTPYILITFASALAGISLADDFNPIPLTTGSFNQDVVVEKTASPPAQSLVNANMDAGTNITGTVGGTGGSHGAFYEIGFGTTAGSGLPFHGSYFLAVSNTAHLFRMAADYTQPNALFVGGSGTIVPQIPTATFTLVTPTAYDHLSFLASAGSGPASINYTIFYADGTSEGPFTISVLDWALTNVAQTATTAWIANGNFQGSDGTYPRVNTSPQAMRLFFDDITLNNPSLLVSNIQFDYVSGGRAAIFGVSGSVNSGANYSPVAVTGYNYDMIIEAPLFKAVTVTMDSGPLMVTNTTRGANNTFYEQGYDLITAGQAWTGLPVHGTTFTAWSNANYSFTMPSSYIGNNCLFVGNYAAFGLNSGTLTLAAPHTYTNLAILASCGNGPGTNNFTIHYADSTTQAGSFRVNDWFQAPGPNAPTNKLAFNAAGRVPLGNIGINNGAGAAAGELWWIDIPVNNTASAVTSIDISWGSGGRSAIFALSGSDGTGAAQAPIGLNASSYNADAVVEASAITNVDLRAFTTSTMDNSTNNNANTWYERGWNPLAPNSGLPPAGSVITSTNLPDHHYQLAASYTGPNSVYADSNNPVANIVFATPTNYSAVSFLSANANQGIQIQVILNHAGAPSETNVFNSKDWFNNAPAAFTASGRCSSDNRSVNNWLPGSSNPRLYEAQFALADTVHNVTGATLIWTTNNGTGGASGANSRFYVLAVSGTLGAVAPLISLQPTNITTFEGSNVVDAVVISGNGANTTYQWQTGATGSGSFTNVVNGGNVSGATGASITFTSIGWTNTGDYRVVVSNPAGSITSSVVTITAYSGLPDVTQPGDPIQAYQPNGGSSPANEDVTKAIDDLVGTNATSASKYLNYGQNGSAGTSFAGPIGLVVSPAMGLTTVSAMRLYTANDHAERDPADYTLEGSNDGGNTWNTISTGPLSLPTGRNNLTAALPNPLMQSVQEVHFPNANSYLNYRLSFSAPSNVGATANCIQIGEVELLGTQPNYAPIITQQPRNVQVFAGGSPSFSVTAFGNPGPLTYQWYRGAASITGATGRSYTLVNAQPGDSGATFSCTVGDPNGSTPSSSATLTVIPAPTTPYATDVMHDNPVAWFRLNEGPDDTTGGGNNGMVAFDDWGGHNGYYTNAILQQPGYGSINAVPLDSDPGAYFGKSGGNFIPTTGNPDSCVEAIPDLDFAATNTSSEISVEAWVMLDSSLSPGGPIGGAAIVCKGFGGGGEQFALDCGGPANGSYAHTFRFYIRDAVTPANAHNANGTIGPDPGVWHHVVGVLDEAHSNVLVYVDGLLNGSTTTPTSTNGLQHSSYPVTIGARSANVATNNNLLFYGTIDEVALYNYALSSNQIMTHFLAAGIAPRFTLQPTNTTVSEGASASIYAGFHGSPTLTVQWYESSDFGASFHPVPGQTSPTLTLASVSGSQNGYQYYVQVSNAYGTATSTTVTLTVISGPPVVQADVPSSLLVYAGRPLSLASAFAGTQPITYQWYRNGSPLANGGRTSGATSNVLTILNAQTNDTGSYQVFAHNAQDGGNPTPSSTAAVLVETVPNLNTNGLGWRIQETDNNQGLGGPRGIVNDVLTLTDGFTNEATSAFYTAPLYIGNFRASFTYQDVGGMGADGFAFVLQNDPRGPAALGAGGGNLGYSGITPSAAWTFNIYNPNTPGLCYNQNGAHGPYVSTTPLSLPSGDPIAATVTYNGSVLSLVLTDAVATSSFRTNVPVNLAALFGTNTAYVGFTGADGGTVSTQQISNFTFIPLPAITAQVTGPNTILLTWPASIGGYALLQESTLTPAGWTLSPAVVTEVGSQYQATVTTSGAAKFYRLLLEE